jgi:trk system potassium uptake protein TrkA
MYIVVVGGGKVGYYLTKSLLEEGHEVLVIERDPRKCATLTDEMSASVLQGDGCEVTRLDEAGLGRADAVVAVTGDDEDNLVICQVAKHRFNVARTIARLNNPKNEHIFRHLGIDLTVSSTDLILSQIEESIPSESLVHLLRLRGFGISFVEVDIPAGASVLGRRLRELCIPVDCLLALVVRDGTSTIIPSGDTELEAGDRVIAVASQASETALRQVLCG